MKNEVQEHFEEVKKLTDLLPTNTKTNRKKKEEYLLGELELNDKTSSLVLNEIKDRLSFFDRLEPNLEIDADIQNLKTFGSLNYYSIYSSAYEKMGLDVYLYELKASSKEDLGKVNECLSKIVESFKNTGVTLDKDDFNFNVYARDYMDLIINKASNEELKQKFEEVYWKFPELIPTIIINIKSIYNRNEKKIDKHFDEETDKYNKVFKDVDVPKTVIALNKQIKDKVHKDPYIIFNNFKTGKWMIGNFQKSSVDTKINKYFTNDSYNSDNLRNLSKTLFEYYMIVKYNFLLNDMKERLEKKEEYKNSKVKALDNIVHLEKKLVSLNKVNSKFRLFKKNDEKWLFNYNDVLRELIEKYDLYDMECFNDVVASKLYSDSSVLDVLKLVASHYVYFANELTSDGTNNINDINKEFETLKEDVNNKEYYMLNNIALLDRKHMKEIISDKYKLEGIIINPDYLEEDAILKTMEEINDIIRYEDVVSSGLSLDDIELYLEMEKITNRK